MSASRAKGANGSMGLADPSGTRAYGTVQKLAFSGSVAHSNAVNAEEVMLQAVGQRCFVRCSSGGTDSVDNAGGVNQGFPIEAGERFHMKLIPGQFIHVVQDTAGGTLYITPVL